MRNGGGGDFDFIALSSRISRSWGSNPGRVQTNGLRIDTCHFLARHSALRGYGKDCLAQCQDNVIEWDIRSWYWWPGLPVGHHTNVVMSLHCHKSVCVLI